MQIRRGCGNGPGGKIDMGQCSGRECGARFLWARGCIYRPLRRGHVPTLAPHGFVVILASAFAIKTDMMEGTDGTANM